MRWSTRDMHIVSVVVRHCSALYVCLQVRRPAVIQRTGRHDVHTTMKRSFSVQSVSSRIYIFAGYVRYLEVVFVQFFAGNKPDCFVFIYLRHDEQALVSCWVAYCSGLLYVRLTHLINTTYLLTYLLYCDATRCDHRATPVHLPCDCQSL